MSGENEKKGPLDGIRVMEVSMAWAGPAAGALLGDMGAEVINIEKPDQNRNFMPGRFEDLQKVRGGLFEAVSRNKKSVSINLNKDKGKDLAHRLAAKCDVFTINIRQKALEKQKLDYPTLAEINPRIVYSRVSGMGPEGPYADRRISDFITQGFSSMMHVIGERESELPQPPLTGILDQTTGTFAAQSIVTALFVRERTGKGQEVHTSILGTAMWMMYMQLYTYLTENRLMDRHSKTATYSTMRNYYKCADGQWIIFGSTPPEWEKFCKAFGQEQLLQDERFSNFRRAIQNSKAAIAIFTPIFATRPRDEWLKIAWENDLVAAPVQPLPEAVADEQVQVNEYVYKFEDPQYGKLSYPGFFSHFSETPVHTHRPSTGVGFNTDEILRDVLGLGQPEIEALRADGVI